MKPEPLPKALGLSGSANTDEERPQMLTWSLVFLVVALIAGILGFTGISAAAAGIAKVLFLIFIVLFLATLLAQFV